MDYDEIIVRGNRRLTRTDIELLERTVREISPKTIVEIGAMDGTSSMVFCHLLQELGGHLYSVEPNPRTTWKNNMEHYKLFDHVTLIMQASPWVDTKIIPKPIDYLFIDGNHKQRWMLVDFHFWYPFVGVGGRIAFHDWDRSGFKNDIRAGIELILKDEGDKLKEVGRIEGNGGAIVFEKTMESRMW
jgi:predicted O-methyltransferase YrrM